MTDEFDFFADEDDDGALDISGHLDVIIVDDEESVHQVTKLALNNFVVDNMSLNFHDAYSGEEAMEMLSEYKGMVLILLDVIMETDHAGLDVVEHIRNKMHNDEARIVLRTGQPGMLNENDVRAKYAIDAFTDKSSLTSDKLKNVIQQMVHRPSVQCQ